MMIDLRETVKYIVCDNMILKHLGPAFSRSSIVAVDCDIISFYLFFSLKIVFDQKPDCDTIPSENPNNYLTLTLSRNENLSFISIILCSCLSLQKSD